MSLKKPARALRGLAGRLPLLTPRAKYAIAIAALVFVWIVGPRTRFLHETNDDPITEQISAASFEPLETILFASPGSKGKDAKRRPTPSIQTLDYEEAEDFCFHYHLEPYNASAPVGTETEAQHVSTQRRIYDLLLITPTTSAKMLELHLASMYPYVEYFVMLEASPNGTKDSGRSTQRPSSGDPANEPSLLDKMWKSQLSAYHDKIIRYSLSQHSEDFKDGVDHEATTRNALYTRVIPLLTKEQTVEPGDVLLISDVEELVRPVTMKVLRNCHIPQRTTIRTRRYWYSFQYMKLDGPGTTSRSAKALPGHSDLAAQPLNTVSGGNEWWPHPQATVYLGANTVLPDELRKRRDLDQYIFGDGGWTCYLCDNTITETLAKLDKAGIVWTQGPRWKAAGRVVDKVMNGVDLLERTNLSRIESNPDLPPYLQANKASFQWMITRDGPGANFVDFSPGDLEEYLAKKLAVDAEPDFETTDPDVSYNLANTQADTPSPPPPPADLQAESSKQRPVLGE